MRHISTCPSQQRAAPAKRPGLRAEGLAGEYVMVAEDAGVPFSVIAPLSRLEDGTRLYKLFSEAVLTQQEVAALFSDGRVLLSHPWKAYPRCPPLPAILCL